MSRPTSPRSAAATIVLPRGVRIVHEDEHLIVVDKPVGLPTAPAVGRSVEDEPSVLGIVREHVRGRRRGLERVVWLVHRLDREVSGLLVCAKSEAAWATLREGPPRGRPVRTDLVLVEGVVDADVARRAEEGAEVLARRAPGGGIEGSIRDASDLNADGPGARRGRRGVGRGRASFEDRRGPGSRPLFAGRTEAGGDEAGRAEDGDEVHRDRARPAVTHWRLLVADTARRHSLLATRVEVDRRDQVRVHCRTMGYAVLGDRRHGATQDPLGRVALHVARLRLIHPASGVPMLLRSEMPAEWEKVVGRTSAMIAELLDAGPVSAVGEPEEGKAPGSARLATSAGWDHVAEWYSDLLEGRGDRGGRSSTALGAAPRSEGSDLHHQVVLPGVVELLQPRQGMRVLDLACGEGLLARDLGRRGVSVVGVDASAKLIDAARRAAEGDPSRHFEVADVRTLDLAALGGPATFDAVTCVMALMNIDPLEPMMQAAALALRPGGAFVAVLLHPAFRAPGQTSWGWTGEGGASRPGPPPRAGGRGGRGGRREERSPQRERRESASRHQSPGRAEADPAAPEVRQFRRVDAYLSPTRREIVMNPGAASEGRRAVTTVTHHRPIRFYVQLLASAGLLVDAMEEWPSPRRSAPGPTAEEENRVRREIPMFLGIRGRKVGGTGSTGV